MKKIYTMLSGLLLASAFTAQAEKITMSVTDANWQTVAGSAEGELILNEDGSYTVTNFIDSEKSISFKFDKPGIGESSPITITSPTKIYGEGYENYPYLLDEEGNSLDGYIWDYNGNNEWLSLCDPYLDLENCVVYGYNPATGSQYYASFVVSGDLYSYDWDTETYTELECPWFYVGFWFDEPKADDPGAEIPDNACDVTFTVKTQVYDEENDEYKWVETGESFTTSAYSSEPNSLTIADFFRSGSPVTFTFNIEKAWSPTVITFKNSYIDEGYEDYPYLLDSNGNYMTCWNIPIAGDEKEPIYYAYVDNSIDSKDAPTSYIYDMEDNDYFLCFYVAGFTADDKDTPYYRLESDYFNLEIMKDDPSAVAKIETNEDAPVIFYNLNGQRVNNPSNGIFIRKQGTKTSKVIIR